MLVSNDVVGTLLILIRTKPLFSLASYQMGVAIKFALRWQSYPLLRESPLDHMNRRSPLTAQK